MQKLLNRTTTFRAFLDRTVRKFLDFLKPVFALFTLILVKRHLRNPQKELILL